MATGFSSPGLEQSSLLPVILLGGLAVWIARPPQHLRVAVYCTFLVLVPAHLYLYARGLLRIFDSGFLDYVAQMCLLTTAFLAIALAVGFVARKRPGD